MFRERHQSVTASQACYNVLRAFVFFCLDYIYVQYWPARCHYLLNTYPPTIANIVLSSDHTMPQIDAYL
ncbi:hypothetical protein BDF19DRAFT_150171 [Syncephalis fuscata]|nr:hypothetical protein BDF19DRAFT_150171 [Syncephalis fuscata]